MAVEELWRLSTMFAMKFGVDVLQLQAPGVDAADFEVLDVIAGDPRSPRAARVLDLNTSVSEEFSDVKSISRPETIRYKQ